MFKETTGDRWTEGGDSTPSTEAFLSEPKRKRGILWFLYLLGQTSSKG
jgi:hypothetical protein